MNMCLLRLGAQVLVICLAINRVDLCRFPNEILMRILDRFNFLRAFQLPRLDVGCPFCQSSPVENST